MPLQRPLRRLAIKEKRGALIMQALQQAVTISKKDLKSLSDCESKSEQWWSDSSSSG